MNFDLILARMRFEARIKCRVGIEVADEPDTDDQPSARALVEWYVEHLYGGPLEGARWACEIVAGIKNKVVERDSVSYAVARTSLADIDKVSVISERIARELDSAIRHHQTLKCRTLGEIRRDAGEGTDSDS